MGQYTRQNSTGDAGEYLVGFTFVGRLGWAYRILDSDTGIDGEVEIFDEGVATGRILKVQVKSSASVGHQAGNEDAEVVDDADGFSVQLKKSDVAYWKLLALPVVLCIAHIKSSDVYYKLIDSTVVIPSGVAATFTVQVPRQNELTQSARDTLIQSAPLRDFNPLTRLLEQVEVKTELLESEDSRSYAFDKGEGLRHLKDECDALLNSVRGLAVLGGWILNEETEARINGLSARMRRQVSRMDHESLEWENS